MSFDIAVRRKIGKGEIALTFQTGPGVTALFGPSGVGKTSLLNMVAGLLRPDAGHIEVAGDRLFDAAARLDIPAHRRACGYVFQDDRLFPHRRVEWNLRYGMGRTKPLLSFDDIVALLGIAPLLDRWPATLSGGEAQRVAIGRALLRAPRFLLMDEPISSLDAARRDEIMALIEQVRDATSLPILYVSHHLAEVERLASHIIEMQP